MIEKMPKTKDMAPHEPMKRAVAHLNTQTERPAMPMVKDLDYDPLESQED